MRASVDEWLLLVADQSYAEVIEGVGIVGPYDGWEWQHRVVWIHMRCISCSLFDGFHLFFATGVIEWTYHDRLPDGDVPR